MSQKFTGERTLMRIFIGESDRCVEGEHKGKPLHDALVTFFRERGFAGTTVVRGIAGFGAGAKVHTDRIIHLSLDLPIVVEVMETEEAIQEVLPVLDRMIGGGLVTLERAHVILYRPPMRPRTSARHQLEGLEPDEVDIPRRRIAASAQQMFVRMMRSALRARRISGRARAHRQGR